eukprot:7648010-Karenia_brevis.AAC.1
MDRFDSGGLSANHASSDDLVFLSGCTLAFADTCELSESPSLLGVPELGGAVLLFAVGCSSAALPEICLLGMELDPELPMFSSASPVEATGSAG